MTQQIISKKIIIRGIVQGIGYRWFVEGIAKEEGICGYVKNNPDGSVEVVAEAKDNTSFERFLNRIKTEHKYAIIKEIDITDCVPYYYKNFKILF